MHLTPPPARKMIEANVPVAVASDYNPNAYCMSMPFVMNVVFFWQFLLLALLHSDGYDDERSIGGWYTECCCFDWS